MISGFCSKVFIFLGGFCFSCIGYSQKNTTEEVRFLLEQAKEERKTNLLQTLTTLKKARHKTIVLDNEELLAQIYYQLSDVYYKTDSINKARIYSDSIFSLPEANEKTKAQEHLLVSIIQRKQGDFKNAKSSVSKAIQYFKTIGAKNELYESYLTLGKILHSEGQNQQALNYYLKSLTYYESVKDKLKQGLILGLISSVYAEINQPKKAEEYSKKSIELLKFFPNSPYYADALNNQGINYYDKKDYANAVNYFSQALAIYNHLKKPVAIAAAEQNLGISYVNLGYKNEGFKHLHKSYKTFKKLTLKDEVSVLTDLGTAHAITKNIDSAYYYFNKAYQVANKKNYAFYKKENLRSLYNLFEENNEYKKALYYHKLYTSYKDSFENNKLKKTIAELEVKYKTAEKEKEIIRLKNKEILSKTKTKLLVIAFILSAIIFFLIIYKILRDREKNKKLQKQQNIIRLKEEEIIKSKLKKTALEEKQLKLELKNQTKQLAAHALNMMQKNKLLKEVSAQISEKTKKNHQVSKQDLFLIKKHLEEGLNIDKDWETFKLYFEQINGSFFLNLKKINPNLTNNDFRLCALIKLNMSLKEMASVLHITPNSVKNARYRLKKKLHLSENDDLKKFISEL